MIAGFFIERPIFASVISIVLVLCGGVAAITLPTTQYPDITPPTIEVSTVYPGANAELVRDTIAAPIEQQVSGVENALSLSSQCTNDGRYRLTITFAPGTDLNMAQVLTQVRVTLAMPSLPDVVQREGVAVLKKSPAAMMIVNFTAARDESGRPRYDEIFLSNYATIQIRDELLRVEGVGDIDFIGQRDYSMRVWLDPEKMAAVGLSAGDIRTAVENQNYQITAGNVGQQPAPRGQAFQIPLSAIGRLVTVEEFGNVIVKETPTEDGDVAAVIVRLRDVARVELGAQFYDQICRLDGEPSVGMNIYQLPGSNAIAAAAAVREKLAALGERFPKGLEAEVVYDTTPFIEESKAEVLKTLRDATILVALVVLLFLQNWRATLIPLIAVPVAIVGTFAFMAALGFSLNTLSLFGLVLAIGIVVDDAIVVVENVERWIERGLAPREAAFKAMQEVTGPVIGVALVLCAVFVPCSFIAGIVGQFFRQFALTIAVSTLLSAINSLTLSPALAAMLLRPHGAAPDPIDRVLRFACGWIFRGFNAGFALLIRAYGWAVRGSLRLAGLILLAFAGLLAVTWLVFQVTPVGFIPEQDKGYLIVDVVLPEGASVQRTAAVMAELERRALEVAHVVSVAGRSVVLGANSPNWGAMYVMLDGFAERRGEEASAAAIAARLRRDWQAAADDARVEVFGPPPVDGLGTVAGFKLAVEDRGDYGAAQLEQVTSTLIADCRADGRLTGLFTNYSASAPWLFLDIDREKAAAVGVPLADLFETLQLQLGSYYINNFNRFGRSWQVNVQADARHRGDLRRAIEDLSVPGRDGQAVPLATLIQVKDRVGPSLVMRYNLYPTAAIYGEPAPGTGSTSALAIVRGHFDRLQEEATIPPLFAAEWTEMAFMQIRSGATATFLFVLGVVLVFLVLAALYESWALPLAVILVVPMCLLSAVVGVRQAGLEITIFTQIGFVVLVGLACKNAILIVEFARQLAHEGTPLAEATVEASRLRLRPILMTSLAFILGVLPLVVAEGAGAEMRRTLGLAVFSGMLGVTLFGIFLTPVFFYSLLRRGGLGRARQPREDLPRGEGSVSSPDEPHRR
ncbi:MAG: multidrug efflux RND transporter permease subunit [Planctomycetota bacterium]|nr:multidrug efflux RND transporter permease subunit [Planctomycetota bacterium]